MPVLSIRHIRAGLAMIIVAGMLTILGLTSAAADPIGEQNNGPAGDYAGHCEGSKSDPVGIVFRGKASVLNARETIAERTGWSNTDTGFTVFGHRLSSDQQELSVRQANGKYTCEKNPLAIASAGGANSRTHVRLWHAYSQSGNGVTVGTPHHEDFVKYNPTNNHCELIPEVLTIGNHAVDKGGVNQPGYSSGFDRGRHEVNEAFSKAGYEVSNENWGNTVEFEQCDEDKAGSDGYGVIVNLVYSLHAHSNPASELSNSGARLNGELITDEPQTTFWWAYGKQHAQGSAGYEHTTSPKSVTGTQQMVAGEHIASLQPNTNYYYRMFVRNQEGVVREGSERQFTTTPAIQAEDSDAQGPHSVANRNGAVDTFFRTPSGGLGHSWTLGESWNEQDISGTEIAVGAVPHPILGESGTIDVFWRKPDGGLGHAWDDGASWHTDTLSGFLIGEPHATIAPNGTINVFFEGSGGNLGRDSYVPGGSWTYDGSAPGSPRSDPMPVSSNGAADIFFKTPSGTLGHAWYQAGPWNFAELPGTEVGPGAMPYPVINANGQIDVFWRTPSDGLGHAWDDSKGWHTEVLPGTMNGEPAPAETPGGAIDVFYRTVAGELGHNWYQPGGQWNAGTIPANVGSDPHPVVQPDGQLDVFWQTTEKEVGHAWDDAAGWHSEGFEVQSSSMPLAVAQPNGTVDVLYRTLAGELGHSWYQQGGEWQSNTLPGTVDESTFEWTRRSTPNAFGTNNRLSGVSCISATFCMATANVSYGYTSAFAYGEVWNGTSWQVVNVPTNLGLELTGVSCISPISCLAVGTRTESSGETVTASARWDGSKWTLLSTPNAQGNKNRLTGVSCTSSTFCMATGNVSYGSTSAFGFGEVWNGTSWQVVSVPNNLGLELTGVSCTSPISCLAVGTRTESSGETVVASAQWDGLKWTLVSTPNAQGNKNRLTGVSCTSSTFCMATGNVSYGYTAAFAFGEVWNGTSWQVSNVPNNLGLEFKGISCTSNSSCVAVGTRTEGAILTPSASKWNGSSWTPSAVANSGLAADLRAVSCTSSCLAVGASTNWTFSESSP